MAQRRFHYEQAFEHYLRANRVPYVAVDEAKKALVPTRLAKRVEAPAASTGSSLKSFDFVVYSPEVNLLIDVKGRKCRPRRRRAPSVAATANRGRERGGASLFEPPSPTTGTLESWVTTDDLDSLAAWQRLFGERFRAVFVFIYLCEAQPPDSLFQEIFEYRRQWYVLRCVDLDDYRRHMRRRSPKWETWSIPARDYARVSRPFEVHRLLRANAGATAIRSPAAG